MLPDPNPEAPDLGDELLLGHPLQIVVDHSVAPFVDSDVNAAAETTERHRTPP